MFSQMTLDGNQTEKSITVLLANERRDVIGQLTCQTGVHISLSKQSASQTQSCSVQGLKRLSANDTIYLVGRKDVSILNASFGLIQISQEV